MLTSNMVAAALSVCGFRARRPGIQEGYHCTQARRRYPGSVRGQNISEPVGPVRVEFRPKFDGVITDEKRQQMLDLYMETLQKAQPKWKVERLINVLEVS